MTNSLRHDFHTDMALTISNEIQYKRSNYYYFLGKIEPWSSVADQPGTIQPDSDYENNLIRSNIVFMRKITPNDVSVVTKRHDWVTGTIFRIYDHTKNLKDTNFYCITNENSVYKCLDNAAGSVSTIKPSGTSFYPFRTADGYLWKYMYTVPSFKRTRFMSLDKIPVQRALTDSFYNKGSVDAVYVETSGSGYSDVQLTTIGVVGSTTGSGASATITVGPTGNITGYNLISGGTGYTAGCTVTVNTITGTGAILTPVFTAGVITSFDITNGGVGYQAGQAISFTTGGAIIIPLLSRFTGSITGVKILNPGSGYTAAPILSVNTSGPGTGKFGNATALLSCEIYLGSVVAVNIRDPGLNYPSDTNTTITVQGDGTGAVFSPIINAGQLVDVVIENSGVSYTSMTLTVSGTGSGAKLNPIISGSDFQSDQSIVEQTTVPGAIYSVVIENGGDNYSSQTQCVITGDGIGCVATPVIVGGVITNVIVTGFGQNYTYATISFVDTLRSVYSALTDAIAYVILSPLLGHGKDAVAELYGDTLTINSSLRQDSNLNKLLQDYRQFGIIKNPKNILTGKLTTEESSLILYQTRFNTTTDLVLDEILVQANTKFRVVHVDSDIVYLQQLGAIYTNIIGNITAETNSSRVYTINNVIQYPVSNKYSGNLLYVSNENPFTFSEEQGIVIKTFLKF